MNGQSTSRPTDTLSLRVIRDPKNSIMARIGLAVRTFGIAVAAVFVAFGSWLLNLPVRAATHASRVLEGLNGLAKSVYDGLPWTTDDPIVREYRARNLPNLFRDVPAIAFGIIVGSRKNYGVLRLKLLTNGILRDLGVVSHQLVTTAGVNKIVSVLNTVDATTGINFKYHGLGTGATAPAIGDTALQTELTTQYTSDNTRATGSQTVGGSSNIYRSVGTNTVDATVAVTEMGLLSQAAVAGGTLLDRFTFTAVNMVSGDSLQTTVDITFPAGS